MSLLRLQQASPFVRKGTAILTFVAAAVGQYLLTRIPVRIDLARHDEYRRPQAALDEDEIILWQAVSDHAGGDLLAYEGNPSELVDLDFDSAQLAHSTQGLFFALHLNPMPPALPGPLDYVTEESGLATHKQSCRTFIEVKPLADNTPVPELHMFQSGEPGLGHYRQIRIRPAGAGLLVRVNTSAPEGASPDSIGCHKMLKVGDWQRPLIGVPIEIAAAPGAAFRFTFQPTSAGSPSWGSADALFESVLLGPARAPEVDVARNPPSTHPPSLALANYSEALTVRGLRLGSDVLQVEVSGKAWVSEDGKKKGTDALRLFQDNPAVAGLLTIANGALLAWLGKLFRGKPAKRPRPTTT